MSLADRFNAAPKIHRGMPCPIRVIMEQLPAADQVVLLDQLGKELGAPDRLATTTIARLLGEEGHTVHSKGVERHRNKVCRCFAGSGL